MTRVAVIGAGPYGLSIAAHLRSHGVPFRIFGAPLETWRHHMPVGMMLKSDGFASSLSAPGGAGTLAEYCADRRIAYHDTDIPVSLELFIDYALEFQRRFVGNLEDRQVVALDRDRDGFVLELDDGEVLTAEVVVGAFGISCFARMPAELEHLPSDLSSHSSALCDLSGFAGRRVIVIGGGSSAVDSATLLAEAGALTTLVVRRDKLKFTPVRRGPRSRWQRITNPVSGLGPSPRLWFYEKFPGLFRYLPADTRLRLIRTVLGPQTPETMQPRLEAGVDVVLGASIERATAVNGEVRLQLAQGGSTREMVADHVVAATGYYPDISSAKFISRSVRTAIRTLAGMPVVSGRFESSVPGLYLVGLLAVNSFGPLMRFVVGTGFVAPRVARTIARRLPDLGVARGGDTPAPGAEMPASQPLDLSGLDHQVERRSVL